MRCWGINNGTKTYRERKKEKERNTRKENGTER